MAMQVTETSAQGLKRGYKVVVSAADLAAKLEVAARGHEGQGQDQRLPPRQGPDGPTSASSTASPSWARSCRRP